MDVVFNDSTLIGRVHGELLFRRVETQMSSLPASEPGRFEVKNRVFSSFDNTGAWSLKAELIGGAR